MSGIGIPGVSPRGPCRVPVPDFRGTKSNILGPVEERSQFDLSGRVRTTPVGEFGRVQGVTDSLTIGKLGRVGPGIWTPMDSATVTVTDYRSIRQPPLGTAEDGSSRHPSIHFKETDKRVQKRKRGLSGALERSVDDLVTDGNGYRFEHSDKSYLIVNLYAGVKDGYTFSAYLPETIENEAQLYRESHLIPYSETYLLDCIDSETVPDRLIATLEREHGINLVHHPNYVICEVRDFRHFPSSEPGLTSPIPRRVMLKPTTETILTDLQRLINKSREDRSHYKTLLHQSPADEALAVKRMRLCNPNYPFDRNKEDGNFVGLDIDIEDKDDLTLDQRNELEKRIVKETSGGLCLDPSKDVGRIANCAQFERFKWNSKELKKSLQVYARKKHKMAHKQAALCMQAEDDGEIESVETDVGKENEAEWVTRPEDETEPNVDPLPFPGAVFQEARKSFRRGPPNALINFIHKNVKAKKLTRYIDTIDKLQIMKLRPIVDAGYCEVPPLSSMDEIAALSQPAEPASIRQLFSENYVTKTEEYVFETERRKHPHRTVVNIYQRNGGENYFGELLQEALDEPSTPESTGTGTPASRGSGSTIPIKPYALDPPVGQLSGSKCQFDLGSSHSVNLYVKQFTDIFTEDGRRPCKITFHKAGQAGPTVLCTSSYKSQMNNGNNNNSVTTQIPPNALLSPTAAAAGAGGVRVGANVIIAHSGAPTPPHNSNAIIVSVPSLPHSGSSTPSTISIPVSGISQPQQPMINTSNLTSVAAAVQPGAATPQPAAAPSSTSSSPSQTNPPVQIVHPQPRLQPSIQISTASQLYAAGIQALTTTISSYTMTTPVQSSATNTARMVQQHHPLLTRPKIFNVNLTPQQQQAMARAPTATIQQAPQLIQALPQQNPQQQGIRVKQGGVTRLLLSAQNSASKPITVIQPQPQTQPNQINISQVQTIQLNSTSLDQAHQHQLGTTTRPQTTQQVQIATHPQGVVNQANNQIMIVLAGPSPGNSLTNQHAIGNTAQHTLTRQGGNVSLNLNAINLDGLLAVSNNNLTTLQQQPHTYVTSTALVNSTNTIPNSMGTLNAIGVSNASLNTLNIVRYNNTGTVTLQPQQVLRQNSVSVMTPQQQAAILSMNSSPGTTGILVSNSHSPGVNTKPIRFQQTIRQQLQQQPELEEMSVPDLNTLLNNGLTHTYGRGGTTKGPSIDVNLNLNLNLSGGSTPTGAAQAPTMSEIYTNGRQNGSSEVTSVDSIFNALSEAIGPDLEQKLENSLVQQPSGQFTSPRLASSTPATTIPQQKASVMTLNDLLGSPPMSASPANVVMNHASSPIQSPQSPCTPSILSPISPNVVTSSIAYTAPRLSALLAGSPSADSSHSLLMETSGRGAGNLFDRLLSQGQTVAVPVQRTGGSRLNPIATATPSVALDHPVLAATLTQGTNPNLRHALTRPTTYRQIAPAPAPVLQTASQQQQQQQQQQLINNLLGIGLMGTNQTPQAQAIRISKANHGNSGAGNR